MDLEDIFLPYGQVPWEDLINLLWAELLSLVEEAWLALDSGVMHLDEERLPLAFLPGAIASQPPMDGDGVAPYEPDFLRAPCSPPPDSASTPTVSGDCLYGISPALKLRLQRSRSFRRRHPSSCKRALSIHKCSQSPAPPFTHIALFMRRSVFYPLAHFVAHLVASLISSVDCCPYQPHYPDVPHSTLGRVCTAGDSPCFSRGHCRVLISSGEEFPLPSGMRLSPSDLTFISFLYDINNYWIFSHMLCRRKCFVVRV